MSDVEIKIEGLEEVSAALNDFSYRVQRRIASESLAASARVMAAAVRSATPVRGRTGRSYGDKGDVKKFSAGTRYPGFLQRSVGYYKQKKGVPRGKIVWLAGPSSAGYYRGWVEKGHKRKGGFVAPFPFIAPAFNRAYSEALSVFVTDLQLGVVDAAARAGLRATK